MLTRKRIVLAAIAIFFPGPSTAQDVSNGGIAISGGWARQTPDGAKNGAAYLGVKNSTKDADTLIAAQSPAAGKVELHEHIKDGDIMRMREVSGGITIPAGASVEMKPGGVHVMLLGLTKGLKEGETVPLTLRFQKAGEVVVNVKVRKDAPAAAEGATPSRHNH